MIRKSLVVLCICVLLCLAALPTLAQSVPNWQPNTAYAVGALVMFNGVEYKCIQSHTSQVGWEPPNVPALWQPVSGNPGPTPTPTPTPAPTPTPTPSSGGGGGSCAAPWNSTTAYPGGSVVSVGSNNYTAQFWSQGANPTTPGNSGPGGTGDPWFSPVPCGGGGGTPTPTPTPAKPTPTPTPPPPGSLLFAVYKDVTINANFNTGAQQTNVTGTVEPVTTAMPNTTLVWAFATGTCGAESWAGITSGMEATNVQSFVSAGKDYIVSTGGANGVFDCPSGAALIGFINTYNSANLVGIDFDIEGGQSQQVIDNLINATIAAEKQFPNLVFSFTIQSLGTTAANPITGGSVGTTVVSEIKRLGLGGNYVVNLMAMDYGSTNANNCVVANNLCDMGQSAVQAAQALNQQSGIPLSHIGLTVDIGQNDTQDEVTSLANVDTICNFAKSNGLRAVRFWSFDRDTPNGNGGASTTNGNGDPALAYNHEYMNACGVK